MRTQSIDTDIATEKVLISLLQKATPAQKFSQVCSLSQTTIQLSKRAIARANSHLTDDQIELLFVEKHYGKDLAKRLEEYIKNLNYNENP